MLDLGCGEGELLGWLREYKHVDARGVEIEGSKVRKAIARGVSVFQGDIDKALGRLPRCRLRLRDPEPDPAGNVLPLRVLREMLRVGRHAIVAFPNFGHWTMRLSHLVSGRSPKTRLFPHDWYDSPNLHFLTVEDFVLLCRKQEWLIEREIYLQGDREVRFFPNLMAEVAVFSIRAR